VRFLCGQCGCRFDADPEAGRGAVCPKCGHVIAVGPAEAGDAAEGAPRAAEGFAAQARHALGHKIYVICGHCGRHLMVPARYLGRSRRCPSCGEAIRIPLPEHAEGLVRRPAGAEEADGIVEAADADDAMAVLARPEPAPTDEAPSGGRAMGAAVRAAGLHPLAGLFRRLGRLPRWVLPTAGAAGAALVVALTVAALSIARGGDGRGRRRKAPDGSAVVVARTRPASRSRPVPRTGPPTAPAPVVLAGCTVPEARAMLFADEGYCPAGPRSVYWALTVRVETGDRPLRLALAGGDVVLEADGQTIPALGAPGGRGMLPGRAHAAEVRVAARHRVTFRVLFEVPRQTRLATLKMPGVEPTAVLVEAGRTAAGRDEPSGAYREQPPRSLRPLLRHPVMAAIQAVPNGVIRFSQRAGGTWVQLAGAQVAGPATQVGEGLYDVRLHHAGEALDCTLRVYDGGRRLILYLAPEPFHQLAYKKTS
jgi:DNA-directed RNA polymerase subunit RPC12/RpoP